MAQNTLNGSIDVQLPVDIFDVQVNIPLIHQVVVAQLAAARQGTHSTKTRAEVSGGGKKPYRQKGTGRARQGSIRAPQYNGGGIVHGPKPRSYDQRTPKKMKAAALRGALSDRARSGRLHVVDSIVGGDKPSTKVAIATLAALTTRPRVLVVVDRTDTITALSLRNLGATVILAFDQLNTYDVLLCDDIVFTQAAFDAFVAARSAEGTATIALSKAATEVVEKGAAKQAAKKVPAKKVPAAKKSPAAKVVETATEAPTKKVAAKKAPAEAKEPAAKKVPAKTASAKKAPAKTASAAKKAIEAGKFKNSAAPLKSGKAPEGFTIKGNEDSMLFHTPDSPWYDQTVAEVWFKTARSAEAAGFTEAGAEDSSGKETK